MNKSFKTLFTLFLGILFFIPTFTANSAAENTNQEKLIELKDIYVKGDISEAEYKAAKKATKTASKTFLTGNDLEELSKLANDAHGSWVLVDAATGKQMADPTTGHVGAHAGKADMMSATGHFGKAAAAFGGVYVLENLASETGNVASRCGSGDCQFNIGKQETP